MSELLRDLWYFAATSRELKRGEMFRREILGEPVVLGRDEEGRAFALRDICPHRAVPLSAGRIIATDGAQTVECPYHGWRFGTQDGVCKQIPSLVDGQPYEASRIRVRHFPDARSQRHRARVRLRRSRASTGEPPPAPEFGLGDFARTEIRHRAHLRRRPWTTPSSG